MKKEFNYHIIDAYDTQSESVLTSQYQFRETTQNCLACIKLSERFNTRLHKELGCLARQTSDVCFSSTVQLFSASCYCRRPYSQSNQTSWDTSFPPVILSLHNRRDDDICSGSLTLGSVWTAAHTHRSPTLDPLSSPLPSFVNSMWSNILFCWFSRLAIFICCELFQTVICPVPGLVQPPAPLILSEPSL